VLLRITSDNEMTPKKKGFTFENFVIFGYIYRIQIVQHIAQLSSKGRFYWSPLFFNSLKFWKQLGWINSKSTKQMEIKLLN
jgi:hypothetical protein